MPRPPPSPAKEAGTVYHAVDTYRWLPGENVLIHDVEAQMAQRVVSMEIYTQGDDGQLRSRSYEGSDRE